MGRTHCMIDTHSSGSCINARQLVASAVIFWLSPVDTYVDHKYAGCTSCLPGANYRNILCVTALIYLPTLAIFVLDCIFTVDWVHRLRTHCTVSADRSESDKVMLSCKKKKGFQKKKKKKKKKKK